MGATHTIGLLQVSGIPTDAAIYRMCLQCLALEEEAARKIREEQAHDELLVLQQQLSELIQEITVVSNYLLSE